MKKTISLPDRSALLAATLAAPFALSGCEEREEIKVYPDVKSCVEAGVYTERACNDAFKQAVELDRKSVPLYPTRAACEADWGKGEEDSGACEQGIEGRIDGTGTHPASGSNAVVFYPYYANVGVRGGGNGTLFGAPLYGRDSTNLRTVSGDAIRAATANGPATVGKAAFEASTKVGPRTAAPNGAKTVFSARGGFGGARGMSFGG